IIIHDFGYVRFSQVNYLEHIFQVKNYSSAIMTVTDLSKSCTCTSASLSHRSIAPGDSADLTMGVRVPPTSQSQQVFCTLETNGEANTKIVYALKFTGLPDMVVDPASLIVDDRGLDSAEKTLDLNVSIVHSPRTGTCHHPLIFNAPSTITFRTKEQRSARLGNDHIRCTYHVLVAIPKAFLLANYDQSHPCSIEADDGRRTSFDLRI